MIGYAAMNHASFDFRRTAERQMIQEGFLPVFPAEVLAELKAIPTAPTTIPTEDLRGLLWSSIDNTESRDLDQVEWAEKLAGGEIRVLVGLADVDFCVKRGVAVDRHAAHNATSVYTGGPAFPMLPEALSCDLTSLVQHADRTAVVVEFVVGNDGAVRSGEPRRALICNRARLTYDRVHRFFSGTASTPCEGDPVAGLVDQLRLQREASERLIEFRKQHGALSFGGVERIPIIVNNQVKGVETVEHNCARDLIESLMIAANVSIAQFLRRRGSMAIRRVVRSPRRWDRIQVLAAPFGVRLPDEPDARALADFLASRKAADPIRFPELSLSVLKCMGPGEYIVEHPGFEREGHFGLAVGDYSHSTAPNRRYADLAMQRLIKACIDNAPAPYSEVELSELSTHCNERESAARHVERFMKKVAAALMLSQRVGEGFDAIVTGVAPKGTFVRLLTAPAEGRLMRGALGLDVGDKLRVRLISVDVERGFIDLEAAGK